MLIFVFFYFFWKLKIRFFVIFFKKCKYMSRIFEKEVLYIYICFFYIDSFVFKGFFRKMLKRLFFNVYVLICSCFVRMCVDRGSFRLFFFIVGSGVIDYVFLKRSSLLWIRTYFVLVLEIENIILVFFVGLVLLRIFSDVLFLLYVFVCVELLFFLSIVYLLYFKIVF